MVINNNKKITFLLMKLVSSPPNFSGHQSAAQESGIVKGKLMAVITIT